MIFDKIRMTDESGLANSVEVGGIFKSKSHFCLRVGQYCESHGKSAVQLRGNKHTVHLVCKHQLYEKRRVIELNKTSTGPKTSPEIKCTASFKANKMKPKNIADEARTGVDAIDSKREREMCAYTVQPGGY